MKVYKDVKIIFKLFYIIKFITKIAENSDITIYNFIILYSLRYLSLGLLKSIHRQVHNLLLLN